MFKATLRNELADPLMEDFDVEESVAGAIASDTADEFATVIFDNQIQGMNDDVLMQIIRDSVKAHKSDLDLSDDEVRKLYCRMQKVIGDLIGEEDPFAFVYDEIALMRPTLVVHGVQDALCNDPLMAEIIDRDTFRTDAEFEAVKDFTVPKVRDVMKGLLTMENGDGEEFVDYNYLRRDLGSPYVWGATGPDTFDCSGLTQWCYAQAGISIPRNSEAQRAGGQVIPMSQLQPGDILWKPGHVGIYIGENLYIHAPHTGDVVKISGNAKGCFTCGVRYN